MKLVKAIVRPDKVDEVRDALEKIKVSGMTVTDVRGHGRQKGHTAVIAGRSTASRSCRKCRSMWSSPTTSSRK